MRWGSSRRISAVVFGALGVPEFGTDFAMQMLIDTEAEVFFRTFVRIAGLAHGTDVWLGKCPDAHPGGQGDDSDLRSVRVMIS